MSIVCIWISSVTIIMQAENAWKNEMGKERSALRGRLKVVLALFLFFPNAYKSYSLIKHYDRRKSKVF